jgi:monoamine oxidase
MLNSTVKTISYSNSGVSVSLIDGTKIEGDYVFCTFSLGVLQHDDVVFDPPLPSWKQEAIQSMTMVSLFLICFSEGHLKVCHWYRQRTRKYSFRCF